MSNPWDGDGTRQCASCGAWGQDVEPACYPDERGRLLCADCDTCPECGMTRANCQDSEGCPGPIIEPCPTCGGPCKLEGAILEDAEAMAKHRNPVMLQDLIRRVQGGQR